MVTTLITSEHYKPRSSASPVDGLNFTASAADDDDDVICHVTDNARCPTMTYHLMSSDPSP